MITVGIISSLFVLVGVVGVVFWRLGLYVEKIRLNESILKAIADNVPAIIYLKDVSGRFLMVNRGFESVYKISNEDAVGKSHFEIFPRSDAEQFWENDRRVLESGEAREFEESTTQDDGTRTYQSINFPIRDGSGRVRAVCCVATDMTERLRAEDNAFRLHQKLMSQIKQMESANAFLNGAITEREKMETDLRVSQARLIQSEKMASLGQLAAGVAHEINNPLGYLSSNLATLSTYVVAFKDVLAKYDSFVRVATGSDDTLNDAVSELRRFEEASKLPYILGDVSELLDESIEGARRVKDIVQRLKVFAHPEGAGPEDFNVNDSIETALKLVWNELKYKCHVRKDFCPAPMVRGHPGQLCQVFMNLLLNAAQAMPEKGDIMIESQAAENGVRIRITDTGHGINVENLSKVFTPFFTTKSVGKGTGLGMSITRDIIRGHGGEITVESKEGEGSTFIIFLPLAGRQNDRCVPVERDCQEREEYQGV